MNLYQLKNRKTKAYPAILFENLLNFKKRKSLRKIIFCILVVLFLITFISGLGSTILFLPGSGKAMPFVPIFILFFVVWIGLYLLEMMYLSYYFRETDIDFEVLQIIQNSDDGDITPSFLHSDFGQSVMARLDFDEKEIDDFLKGRSDFVSVHEYEILDGQQNGITLVEFAFSIIHFDSDFNRLLKEKEVTVLDFKNTLKWVSGVHKKNRENEKWWTTERFLRIPSVGKKWNLKRIGFLERFGHVIYKDTSFIQLGDKARLLKEEAQKIEIVLVDDRGSNVMLVSEESGLGLDVVATLGKMILDGTVNSNLEDRRVYVLDIDLLISSFEDKEIFRSILFEIFVQSINAKDIILVIPRFSDFLESSDILGVDTRSLLLEVLKSSRLQVIALSNSQGFHQSIETDLSLMKHFEKIVVGDLDIDYILRLVEEEAVTLESKEQIFFTYQAIKKIIEIADRYFDKGNMVERAINMLHEISNSESTQNKKRISADNVMELIEENKIKPSNRLNKYEKKRFDEIEEQLRNRIIGQDNVISSIIDSMKKARMGIVYPQRPLASFVFIGPLGVGKREVAKALAEVFFGSEDYLSKIDMSEFNSVDAVSKLTGGVTTGSGVLCSRIQNRRQGVLLLDKFEKVHKSAYDTFIQMTTDGFFYDGFDERVNVRDFIIVATSNVEEDLIDLSRDKKLNIKGQKQNIVDQLINDGVLDKSILNSFDDVIVFDRLTDKSLEVIVSLIVDRVISRLDDMGIVVEVKESLISYLIGLGKVKGAGIKEINRAVRRDIEDRVSELILDGIISRGDTIIFVESPRGIEIKKLIK